MIRRFFNAHGGKQYKAALEAANALAGYSKHHEGCFAW